MAHRNKPVFEVAVWLSSATITLLVLGMCLFLGQIIAVGLSSFWPKNVYSYEWFDVNEEEWLISAGQLWEAEELLSIRAPDILQDYSDYGPADLQIKTHDSFKLLIIKTGNRKMYGQAYIGIPDFSIRTTHQDANIAVLERREWGDFIGYIDRIEKNGEPIADDITAIAQILASQWPLIRSTEELIQDIKQTEIGAINQKITVKQRLLDQATVAADKVELNQQLNQLSVEYEQVQAKLDLLQQQNNQWDIVLRSVDDQTITLKLTEIFGYYFPNQLSWFGKLQVFATEFIKFLIEDPRESNSEGGIAPAIFGTIILVFMMTIVVSPLGVITAVYMHEYSSNGKIISFVRILVNNLAGVPSIVFGIFGLGFFVYSVGSFVDTTFYADQLPTPTFGTPGLLWSALTLALLTLPVVIVSTEEGLARIPRAVREGGLALGATKWETMKLLVIPMSSPAILTGIILAIARAAGEVAPLMLVGVVKLSNQLPLDNVYPYLHLERKFMHLGFHIFDLAFQSPDVESSIPTAYATALVLMLLVLLLNVVAFMIRSKLRNKYKVIEI